MQIQTDRLLLREFGEDDWADVLAYQTDARYLSYYAWEQRTAADVQAFVAMLLAWQAQTPRIKYQLAIVHGETGSVIGNCGIRMSSPHASEADLGYELSPECWGQGYASEAARAMLGFGFGELGLHRIWAHCIAENHNSVRLLERLGMQLEGRLRDKERFKGRWWDVLIYAMLETEWTAS